MAPDPHEEVPPLGEPETEKRLWRAVEKIADPYPDGARQARRQRWRGQFGLTNIDHVHDDPLVLKTVGRLNRPLPVDRDPVGVHLRVVVDETVGDHTRSEIKRPVIDDPVVVKVVAGFQSIGREGVRIRRRDDIENYWRCRLEG